MRFGYHAKILRTLPTNFLGIWQMFFHTYQRDASESPTQLAMWFYWSWFLFILSYWTNTSGQDIHSISVDTTFMSRSSSKLMRQSNGYLKTFRGWTEARRSCLTQNLIHIFSIWKRDKQCQHLKVVRISHFLSNLQWY